MRTEWIIGLIPYFNFISLFQFQHPIKLLNYTALCNNIRMITTEFMINKHSILLFAQFFLNAEKEFMVPIFCLLGS